MPVKKIFTDHEENELQAYVNDKAKLFISIAKKDDDGGVYGGWITLDNTDLNEFIDLLVELRDEVFDESELVTDTAAG